MLLSLDFDDVCMIISRHVIGKQSRIDIIIIIMISHPILITRLCLLQAEPGRVCVFLWRAE